MRTRPTKLLLVDQISFVSLLPKAGDRSPYIDHWYLEQRLQQLDEFFGRKKKTVPPKDDGGIMGGSLVGPGAAKDFSDDLVNGGPPKSMAGRALGWGKGSTMLSRVQDTADVIGIADPTGAVDGVNALAYLAQGKFGDAAASAVSMVPFVGDLVGKGAKLGARWLRGAKAAGKSARVAGKESKLAGKGAALGRKAAVQGAEASGKAAVKPSRFTRAKKMFGRAQDAHGRIRDRRTARAQEAPAAQPDDGEEEPFSFDAEEKAGDQEIARMKAGGGSDSYKLRGPEDKPLPKANRPGDPPLRSSPRAAMVDVDTSPDLGRKATGPLSDEAPPPSLARPDPGPLARAREASQRSDDLPSNAPLQRKLPGDDKPQDTPKSRSGPPPQVERPQSSGDEPAPPPSAQGEVKAAPQAAAPRVARRNIKQVTVGGEETCPAPQNKSSFFGAPPGKKRCHDQTPGREH